MKSTPRSRLPFLTPTITSPVVLCGTTSASMPAIERKSSPARCWVPPGVMVPIFILPGFAFALSIASLSVLTGESAPVTITMLKKPTVEIIAKSRSGS